MSASWALPDRALTHSVTPGTDDVVRGGRGSIRAPQSLRLSPASLKMVGGGSGPCSEATDRDSYISRGSLRGNTGPSLPTPQWAGGSSPGVSAGRWWAPPAEEGRA